MLKFKKITFENIGRFVDKQTIDFESLGDFIQIDGHNHNTGGSSAASKSTVFKAIEYLFGINSVPATALQSRLTKDPILVEGFFDWDGKNVFISRGKKEGLKIEIDGQMTSGSSSLAEEKLLEVMGLSPDLFRKILHKRQKEPGFFLEFTPKKVYEFLTDCLGLTDILNKTKVVETKIASLTKEKTSKENELNANESSLLATQESVKAFGERPVQTIDQTTVQQLKEKYDLSIKLLTEAQMRCENENQELEKERPQITTPIFDSSRQEELEKERKGIESRINALVFAEHNRQSAAKHAIADRNNEQIKINVQLRDAETAKQQAIQIAEKIKKIKSGICDQCGQQWINDAAKLAITRFTQEIIVLRDKIVLETSARNRLEILTKEIADLQEQTKPIILPEIDELKEKIASIDLLIAQEKVKSNEFYALHNSQNKELLRVFAEKQNLLKNKQDMELNQLRGQTVVDKNSYDSSLFKFRSYEESVLRFEKGLSLLQQQEKETESKIKKLKKEIKKNSNDLDKAEELKRMLKSYASCSFDEALESIGEMATKIIRSAPTMANSTIQIEGLKENKDGKIKEEINTVINLDGDVAIPIKTLCGGEGSAADLAIDLAFIDFIENRSGKGTNLFILDEPFGGMDTINIEPVLKMLKDVNLSKKLIIVDHNPEVKQMVSDTILVERIGTTSNIV